VETAPTKGDMYMTEMYTIGRYRVNGKRLFTIIVATRKTRFHNNIFFTMDIAGNR
jgi:hypothetical protein